MAMTTFLSDNEIVERLAEAIHISCGEGECGAEQFHEADALNQLPVVKRLLAEARIGVLEVILAASGGTLLTVLEVELNRYRCELAALGGLQ